MAKKIDPKSLTLDYKQLLGIPVQDRISLWESGGQSYFESLTPEQLSRLFPKYYQRQLPDIGKAVSGGTAGVAPPAAGADRRGVTSGALGRAARSDQAPGQPKPSAPAEENALLKHLESITGKTERQTYATSGTGIDRSRFKKELENNPELAQRIMSLAKAEVGSQGPSAQQKWMETIFNRAHAQGKSLAQVIDPNNGYWPAGQKRPQLSKAEMDTYQATLGRVVAGSNESNFATDNASGGLARRRQQTGRVGTWDNGEFFYTDFQYRKAMEGLRAQTEQRAQQRAEATSVQKPEQERQSQSGAATGLTPESPVPGKKVENPNQVTQENSREIIAQAVKGDKTIGDRILDRALQLEGMTEIENRRTIQKYLKNGGKGVDPALTPWCADFVNATLAQEGIKGTGSPVATSFSNWGIGVDPTKVQKGDVVVQHRNRMAGQTGGHVAFATGQTRVNPRTGRLEIEMYGGNQTVPGRGSIAANRQWIDASKLYVRRSQDAEEIKPTAQDIKYPKDYDSWNPNLKKYIESLPPSTQQKIFDQSNELVRQGKGHINDIYSSLVQQNPNIFSAAPKVVTDAVKNAPPGEMPTITDADLEGSNINAEPYSRVVTNISGYSPGSTRPKAAGPGVVQSTTEELNILKRGIDDRGPSLGYHAAVASFYYNKNTGEKIDETSFQKLPKKDQDNYVEKAEVHQLRNPSKRVSSMGGINPQTGKPWNADTYAVVRVGKMSPEKIRAYEEHLAEKYAKGEIPEQAIRNIYGDGALRPKERGQLEASTGGEGVADATSINKGRIFERAAIIKKQLEQAASQALPTPPGELRQTGTPPTQVLQATPTQVSPAVTTSVTPAAPSVPGPAAKSQQPAASTQPAPPQPTATPVTEAPPRQEDVPPKMEYGGENSLKASDQQSVIDRRTGEVIANVDTANGEKLLFDPNKNSVEGIPNTRTDPRDLIPTNNTITSESNIQTQTEMPTNSAGMTSQPMMSTADPAPSAQQVFAAMMESPASSNPSYGRAMAQYSFKGPNKPYGQDSGFNTLFG